MLSIKIFDEEYSEYKRVKSTLYNAYLRHPDNLTGDTLDNYDKFIKLYEKMKQRYNTKITSKGFIAWLDSIDEFEP